MSNKIKSFTFKPEFESKLKRLRVKQRFIRGINTCDREDMGMRGMSPIQVANELNKSEEWYSFICRSFDWQNSVEGHEFWWGISQQ